MSESTVEHYARRIFDLAMTDPEVDPLDDEQLHNYAMQKAEELHLPKERVAEEVANIRPMVEDFQRASEIGVQTKDII